ncbi:hypothetical protein LCGC14_2096830, partial [marine sediment metagenome]
MKDGSLQLVFEAGKIVGISLGAGLDKT